MSKVYTTLRHLSIDIVIGAVVLLHFFSLQFEATLSWEIYFLLASAVWMIYTIDHLRDAKEAKVGNRERYQYHLRNERMLKWTFALVALVSLALIFYLPTNVLLTGLLISFLGLLYMLFQKRLAQYRVKEFYVSVIYSAGILLPLYALVGTLNVYFLLVLTLIAFSNLLIFSWMEKEVDERDGFTSIATKIGSSRTHKLILIVLSTGLSVSIIGFSYDLIVSIYFVIAFLTYLLIWWKSELFRVESRYRVIGDAIFLLPIVTFF